MDLDVHLGDKVQKTKYVSTMFDIIAPGYDKFTRVFSFGMDKNWKAALVEEAIKRARERPAILDLASTSRLDQPPATRFSESSSLRRH